MDPANEPFDINWKNMSGQRGLYFWRRFLILIVSFMIMLLLSTPSTILSVIQHADILNIGEASLSWIRYIPFIGDPILQYLPPLLVLMIN